jgi:hypothetical protein
MLRREKFNLVSAVRWGWFAVTIRKGKLKSESAALHKAADSDFNEL